MGKEKTATGRKASRARILEATIELLLRARDPSDLTIRAITERAEVGVGLVNYHFHDKGNLVREAVRTFISRSIVSGYARRTHSGSTARDRVASLLLGPIDFLVGYPQLSRVSVLFDLSEPVPGDNSDETFHELGEALRVMVPESTKLPELSLRLWMVVAGIHEAFLRPERFRARTGLDYGAAEGRKALARFLSGLLLGAPRTAAG